MLDVAALGRLRGSGYVYVMYTYDADAGPAEQRRAKIRRYTFDAASEQLRDPVDLLTDLPHGTPPHRASLSSSLATTL